jgi:hypothetical protein
MAEAHKFNGSFGEATEVFPDLPWKGDAGGGTWIYDEKAGDYVPVAKGQFIYKVGDRYEVRDSEELPKTAKPATDADAKPVEKALAAKEEAKAATEED